MAKSTATGPGRPPLDARAHLGDGDTAGREAGAAAPELGARVDVTALHLDPANRRRRTARGRDMLVRSLKETGAARSIVIDEHDEVLAGNGVVEAAGAAGITRVRIIDAAGDELIAVRRSGLTDAAKRALAIFDNRTSELSEWNGEQLELDRSAGLDLQPFWTAEEEALLVSRGAVEAVTRMAGDTPPVTEDAPAAVTAGDFQTFSCPLTVEQERTVRAALRQARNVYQVTTAGDALTRALQAWAATQQGAV